MNRLTQRCANPACSRLRELSSEDERGQYLTCGSMRCVGLLSSRRMTSQQLQARAKKAGEASAAARRQGAMARLAGLTSVEIYRKAFRAGWHAGARHGRKVAA